MIVHGDAAFDRRTNAQLRGPNRKPVWGESVCAEGNQHVVIEDQPYMLSSDGYLMPAKKDQKPPDLTYFKKSGNRAFDVVRCSSD